MIANDKYEKIAVITKAMSHPTRLFIIDKLQEKEYCVCELQKLIDSDMSTVSKHLSILRNAGLINSRKVENHVYYNLSCGCFWDIFSCLIDVCK